MPKPWEIDTDGPKPWEIDKPRVQPISAQDEWSAEVDAMPAWKQAIVGVGKGMKDVYSGIKQTGAEIGNKMNLVDDSTLAAINNDIADERRIAEPLTGTLAGALGNVGGSIAATLPAMLIPGANTLKGQAALGAGLSAIAPMLEGDSRLGNAAVGGALGGAIGGAGKYMGNKIGAALAERNSARGMAQQAIPGATQQAVPGAAQQAVPGSAERITELVDDSAGLTGAQKRILEWAKTKGLRVTPGQETGSTSLQQLEAKAQSQPYTSGPFNSIKPANQEKFNEMAAAAIGEKSKVLDSATIEKSVDRMSSVYDKVRNTGARQFNGIEHAQKVADIGEKYLGLIGDGSRSVLDHPLVTRFMSNLESGSATSEQLSDLASKMGKAAAKQMTGMGDRDLGLALFEVKNQVDDLLKAGLPADLQKAFGETRSQYRNLMLMTGSSNVLNTSSGNVNPVALARTLASKDRRGFVFNKNSSDLYNLARFAQGFQGTIGDSGTATRIPFNAAEVPLAVIGNVASRAYMSQPGAAVARAAANGPGRVTGAIPDSVLQAMTDEQRNALLGGLLTRGIMSGEQQ